MNSTGAVFIILGIFLAIATFFGAAMILPFPYGLVGGGIGSILVLIVFIVIATRFKEKPI